MVTLPLKTIPLVRRNIHRPAAQHELLVVDDETREEVFIAAGSIRFSSRAPPVPRLFDVR